MKPSTCSSVGVLSSKVTLKVTVGEKTEDDSVSDDGGGSGTRHHPVGPIGPGLEVMRLWDNGRQCHSAHVRWWGKDVLPLP